MEPDEEIFLNSMKDLRQRTDFNSSTYDISQACGLVRRLLLDQKPVAHRVNRKSRVPFRCSWGNLSIAVKAADDLAWTPMLWLDPAFYALREASLRDLLSGEGMQVRVEPLEGSLDQFLQFSVVQRSGEAVSASKLISYVANQDGGVHYDPDSRKVDPLISDVVATSRESLYFTALACARIIYASLEPLALLVTAMGRQHPYGLRVPAMDDVNTEL